MEQWGTPTLRSSSAVSTENMTKTDHKFMRNFAQCLILFFLSFYYFLTGKRLREHFLPLQLWHHQKVTSRMREKQIANERNDRSERREPTTG